MTTCKQSPRAGFTMLEITLALAIGVILMIALYFVLDINLTTTNQGRTQVDQAEVARYVLKTVTRDIKDHLALLDAYPPPTKANANASTTTTTTPAAPVINPLEFNTGLQGDSTRLQLFVSRVAKSATQYSPGNGLATNQGAGNDAAVESDLRRIIYWLVPLDGNGNGGLARQEVQMVTNEDIIAELPPDITDPEKMVISEQVIGLIFQYFDGTTWLEEWNGLLPGPDGVTPIGPPLAISIEVYLARKGNTAVNLEDPTVRRYRHVVPIPTASFNNSAAKEGGM